jgi:hypothetical protein
MGGPVKKYGNKTVKLILVLSLEELDSNFSLSYFLTIFQQAFSEKSLAFSFGFVIDFGSAHS